MAPARAAVSPDQEGTFSMGSSHTLDQLDTCFDDTHAVANAGLLLPATLAERLSIEQAANQMIDLGERAGAYRPGRRLLTLVHSMLAGGNCIDDADLLRCGQTASVLGHRVMAPSTLGTFLRSFTFGHVRQLDRLTEQTLKRAWVAGAGPGDGPMTMDLDSTVCQVHGDHKQGAAYGYTHTLGYHPLVATRADSGEVATVELCIRDPQRRGRPAASSLGEVCRQRRLARDRHAGAQPVALDRPDRAGRPRGAGGGQDPAPQPAGPARPHHPLRQAIQVAPARSQPAVASHCIPIRGRLAGVLGQLSTVLATDPAEQPT
jgi:hypothetical protein